MTIVLNGTTGVTTSNLEISGYGIQDVTSLTDAATIDWDWSTHQLAEVTISGYRTMNTPVNAVAGQYAALRVNRAGNFSLSFPSVYKGLANIGQSSLSGKVDHFVFRYNGTNFELVSFKSDIGA